MDTKTALGAAGGITLTVAGAVSALFLTLGGAPTGVDDPSAPATVEYVDQYGDPVDLQQPALIPEIVIATESAGVGNADTLTAAAPEYAEAGDSAGYEEEEHDEEEDAHEEHEDEYGEPDDD